MERLTERHTCNGKNYVSVDSKKNGMRCSNFCTYCGKADCEEIRKALFKLAEYEDLEEQGRLLKLPAAVGNKVYQIFMDCPKDYKEEYCEDHEGSCGNCHHRVPEIVSSEFRISGTQDMGKIFTTREEAEAALKEVNGGTGK